MRFALLTILVACGPSSGHPKLDAHGSAHDGPKTGDGPDNDDQLAPYAHTISIDGSDDFKAVEQFSTTTTGFGARVAWDATNLYVGYAGPDLVQTVADADQKWLFVYVDLDPGAATGATTSVTYRTQHAKFPTGFGAELHARWKVDNTFREVSSYSGGSWTATSIDNWGHANDYVELAIPRSSLSPVIGVTTWMITEKDLFESSYAGLYAGNFADGYAMELPLTKYLRVDFASPNAPTDAGNEVTP